MNKLFTFLLTTMLLFFGCSDDSGPIGGGIINPEPELVGCEAAELYDWSSMSFSTSLGANETLWLAFQVDEMAIYNIGLDATGFECSIFDQCNPDNMAEGDSLLNFFVTTGVDEIGMGVVVPGIYYVSMLNTRNRADFNFNINIEDIILGCLDDNAINYNPDANVEDGSCEFNDCATEYWTSNYGDMVLDCNGNCSPANWIGDGWCDQGDWGVYDEEGNVIAIDLWCEELNWDEGDCEEIIEGCTEGLIEDCNGICAPEGWLGDGFCDDGSYEYNGNQIFFNCEEFNNDNGDCDVLQRGTETRPYPNGRILIR